MAKLPRPPEFTDAYQSPESQMLEAIGLVAVAAAGVEDTLHHLYWKLAGLNSSRGRIVTGDMRASRLLEDVSKFARNPNFISPIAEDLLDLMKQTRGYFEKRNIYLHWIWEVRADQTHAVSAPANKSGETLPCALEDIQDLAADLEWIETRLEAHCMTDEELRKRRRELGADADLYAPAPWL